MYLPVRKRQKALLQGSDIMFFSLEKMLYPVQIPCKLIFRSLMPVPLDTSCQFTLNIYPVSGLRLKDLSASEREAVLSIPMAGIRLTQEGEALSSPVIFPQEDRYVLRLYCNNKEIEVTEIYALEKDLFERNPFKGDTHMHSFLSAGGKSGGNESPEYVAAACRWRGYDFVAITDHHRYEPSQRCKRFFEPLQTDFLPISGEEVHAPGNPVHIVNLGGRASVNEWAEKQEDAYRAAVSLKLGEVSAKLSEKDRFAVASSYVVFDKIREFGGIAVLCHPSWIRGTTMLLNESQDVTDCLFDDPRFDAYELMAGGAYLEGTQVQISYCMGRQPYPALGCSDAHATCRTRLSLDCDYYSIVFAKELTEKAILEAIREGLCVAACGERFIGPYRLVRYSYYLMQYVFPQHDRLCERQGQVFLKLASSRPGDDFLWEQVEAVRNLPIQYLQSVKEKLS